MLNKKYRVLWKRIAVEKFSRLFNVEHKRVFRNSKHILSQDPIRSADGIADFPGYDFNGYYWMKSHNVILIYCVDADEKIVRIEACYSALTGEVAELFYNVLPEDEH